jgi:iron complex outermembrane recepter protein
MSLSKSRRDQRFFTRLLEAGSGAALALTLYGVPALAQNGVADPAQLAASLAPIQIADDNQPPLQLAADPEPPPPQTAQAAPQGGVEAITVTGSRISSPGLISPNPITTITSVDIEQTGLQNLSEILEQSPQFQNNQTPSNSPFFVNGANIDAANLRSLGPYRTLVLIDGIRQVGQLSGVNNSGGTGIVDLNTIPPLLIDSIDVVTGGESAVYGADAVAGVTNFKLKRNFEGVEATSEYGTTTDGGGTTTSFDAIFGANFNHDKGNLTFTTDYDNTASINGFERPTLSGGHGSVFTATTPVSQLVCCTASGFLNESGAPVIETQIGNHAPGTQTFSTNGQQVLPFNAGTPIPGFGGQLVFAGTGQGLVDPTATLTAGGLRNVDEGIVTYKLLDDFGPFKTVNFEGDVKFADSRGTNFDQFPAFTAGPPQVGVSTSFLTISTDNPFVPTALKNQLNAAGLTSFEISRTLNDYISRETRYDYELLRNVVGFDGELTNGWNYNVYYNYGRNQDTFINGSGSLTNFNNALNAVVGPNGTIECADTLINPTDGCTPINPFKVGPLSQQQQRFVFFLSKEVDVVQEQNVAANINGDLFHYTTPFNDVDVPLGFAFGTEYRKEGTNSLIDAPSQQAVGSNADGTQFGGTANLNQTFSNMNANLPTSGIYTTREFYTELRVPVLRDLDFAKALDVGGAIRFQDFSTTGQDYTFDLNTTYAVNSDILLRGSLGKSVRAPNADELFSAGGQSFVAIADPCSNLTATSNPTLVANCRRMGVPVGFNAANSGQSAEFLGGNLNLEAETGRDFTGGFVLTPHQIPHFTATADYFQIRIQNPIEFGDVGTILNGCYLDNIQADCNTITRRSDGSIGTISVPYVNGSLEKIRGLDLSADYLVDDELVPALPADGKITLGANLSYVPQHYLRPVASDPSQIEALAGQFGFPRFTGGGHAQYSEGNFTAGYNIRFIGETTEFQQGTGESFEPSEIPIIFYHDINASYIYNNFEFSFGIQNLFDQLPPVQTFAGSPEGNITRPGEEPLQSYDVEGRFIYTKLKISF